MGRAIGLKGAFFAGARIAGKHDPNAPAHMIFVPAHLKNGVFISQRASFSAYVNSNKGKKDATGKIQADLFNFTAWGKLANAVARGCSVGRALDLFCTPTSYLKPIVDAAGNPVMNRNGTQLQIPTVSFRIDNIVFAEEAAEVIAAELREGRRPVGWDDRSNQQAQTYWRQICAENNAVQPNWAAGIFKYARILMPTGQGIQLVDPNTRQPIAVPTAAPAGNVAGVMQAANTVMQPAARPNIPAGYVMRADGSLVPAAAPATPAPGYAPAAVNATPGYAPDRKSVV